MATTINSYSDAIEAYIADPSGDKLTQADQGGKVHRASFVVTLASQAAGEDIRVATVPAGSQIVGGEIWASATLSNSAQVSVGLMGADGSGYVDRANSDADDVAELKAAAVLSTTRLPIAYTSALGFLKSVEKDNYVTLTTSVGTVGTEVIYGYVEWVNS